MHLNSFFPKSSLIPPHIFIHRFPFLRHDKEITLCLYSIPDTAGGNRNLILNFLSGLSPRPVLLPVAKFATKGSLTLWRVDPDERGEWKRQYLQTPLIFRSFPLSPSKKKKKKREILDRKKKSKGVRFQKPGADNRIVENNDAISASCAVFTPLTKRLSPKHREGRIERRSLSKLCFHHGRLDRTFVNRTVYRDTHYSIRCLTRTSSLLTFQFSTIFD